MQQSPVIINIQQNVSGQGAPPSNPVASPPPVVKHDPPPVRKHDPPPVIKHNPPVQQAPPKTKDDGPGTNNVVVATEGGKKRKLKTCEKVGFAMLAVIVLIVTIALILEGMKNGPQDFCKLANPYHLAAGEKLILRPPNTRMNTCYHPVDDDGEQLNPFDSRASEGCIAYYSGYDCDSRIISEGNQISYQLRYVDIDPDNGDNLSIEGPDEEVLMQTSSTLWTPQDKVQTMENLIHVKWYTEWPFDNSNEDQHVGWTLWVWEEDPNQSRSNSMKSTTTTVVDSK